MVDWMGVRGEARGEAPTQTITSPLLDLLATALLLPLIVGLFWGLTSPPRLALVTAIQAGLTAGFGFLLWRSSRREPEAHEGWEMRWCLATGLVAATLPWILSPASPRGHATLALVFAAVMATNTMFAALRRSRHWRLVLAVATASYAIHLAGAHEWVLATGCVLFGMVLVGGHDAVQSVVDRLRTLHTTSEAMALTDPLTGLANRRHLHRYIDWAAEDPQAQLRVASVDIDDFKQINDEHGHPAGDAALVGLAEHLQQSLGNHWLTARTGGDEFVCVSLSGSLDEAGDALSAIPGQLFEDRVIPINVSVGLTEGPPGEQLVTDAAAALKLAKRQGKQRITRVDDELRAELLASRRRGRQLAEAASRQRIELWAQPVVDLASRELHSYFCEGRWIMADGTPLPPETFWPLLDDRGLARRVAEMTVGQAANFAAALGDHQTVSVVVPAAALIDPGLADAITGLVQQTQLAPGRLTIAVPGTDDRLLREPARNSANSIRDAGLGLALTGVDATYFGGLTDLRCSRLSLKPELASADEGSAGAYLLAGFGSMAADTGVEVVATGIESVDHAVRLDSLGIPLGRGPWFGSARPIPEPPLCPLGPVDQRGPFGSLVELSQPASLS